MSPKQNPPFARQSQTRPGSQSSATRQPSLTSGQSPVCSSHCRLPAQAGPPTIPQPGEQTASTQTHPHHTPRHHHSGQRRTYWFVHHIPYPARKPEGLADSRPHTHPQCRLRRGRRRHRCRRHTLAVLHIEPSLDCTHRRDNRGRQNTHRRIDQNRQHIPARRDNPHYRHSEASN